MDAGEQAVEVQGMSKPFDIADLQKRCKDAGIDLAEDLAKALAQQTISWVKDSCAIHPNMMLRLFAPMLDAVRAPIMAELDKIDGRVG